MITEAAKIALTTAELRMLLRIFDAGIIGGDPEVRASIRRKVSDGLKALVAHFPPVIEAAPDSKGEASDVSKDDVRSDRVSSRVISATKRRFRRA